MTEKKYENIALFWDSSHIWGFLAWHSLQALNIPFSLVRPIDIHKGIDSSLLIVPGGSARRKAAILGNNGQDAIRKFVADGGNYLGFCGGAGLALTTETGLKLCPWTRCKLHERLLHQVSGHFYVDIEEHSLVPPKGIEGDEKLPIWFPARFEPVNTTEENKPLVLASYAKPSADFFMSDLPLSAFSIDYSQECMYLYGRYLDPHLKHEPTTILGNYGKGTYVLSYAHLETPNSPYANRFYFNILHELGNIPEIEATNVPELDLNKLEVYWGDKKLLACREQLNLLFTTGLGLQLFFPRTPWLYGWKNGMQGTQLANLRIALHTVQSLVPNNAMLLEWARIEKDFMRLFKLFIDGARSWVYARRLCQSLPEAFSVEHLTDQQNRLFGSPMKADGICGELILYLELLFLKSFEKDKEVE